MKRIKTLLTVVGLTVAVAASAQSQGQMRLNEYLVVNTDDVQDDFGQKNAWIELFNASYGTVDIGGCYLSNSRDDLRKYVIPGGDVLTQIPPRQHVIFWADNQPFRGTFHLNFTITPGEYIYLSKAEKDENVIIDSIKVFNLPENVSYGRVYDGVDGKTQIKNEDDLKELNNIIKDCKAKVNDLVGPWAVMNNTTASTNNAAVNKASKPDRMAKIDPHGWIMALTAMSVVFSALVILYLLFKAIGIANIRAGQKKEAQAAASKAPEGSVPAAKGSTYGQVSAETYAAIATALHLYTVENEAHDEESYVVTQAQTDRRYTPWSTHIQGFRQIPDVKRSK